jgi:hypothetical protein
MAIQIIQETWKDSIVEVMKITSRVKIKKYKRSRNNVMTSILLKRTLFSFYRESNAEEG